MACLQQDFRLTTTSNPPRILCWQHRVNQLRKEECRPELSTSHCATRTFSRRSSNTLHRGRNAHPKINGSRLRSGSGLQSFPHPCHQGALGSTASLHNLTVLTLWLGYGEFILSDSVLEAFAEAWPALVSLEICFRAFRPYTPGGPPRPHPATVTLRSFHALSRHCPYLQMLHIPHLYVPPEDCYGNSNVDSAEHALDHKLWKLVVCRAFIVDPHTCALALHRIFPHLDIDHSRAAYLRMHDACQEDYLSWAAWLNTLDALEGCQPPASHAEPSCCDASQRDSSGP